MAMVLKSHSISDVISANLGGNIRGEGGLDFSQSSFAFRVKHDQNFSLGRFFVRC